MTATTRKATARFVDKLLILGAAVVLLFLAAQRTQTSNTGGVSHMTVQCGTGPVVSIRQDLAYACP